MADNKSVDLGEFEVSSTVFLDAVQDQLEAESRKEAEQPTEEGDTPEPEEKEEGESEESEEGTESDEVEEELEPGDESDEEEPQEEDEEEDDEGEKKPSKAQTLTLPDGAQYKVTDDATIKIKVDGRYEKVSVGDLKQNYNGKVKSDEIIRRSSEAQKAAETKLAAIKAEDEQIRGHVAELSQAISKGGVMEALSVVAQMEGKDAGKVIEDWVSGLTTFINDWGSLSEQERESKVNAYKLSSEVKGLEAKRNRIKEEATKAETDRAIAQACEEHGLTKEELKDAYTALETRNAKLKEAGRAGIEFTLSDVVSTALDFGSYDSITRIAEDSKITLSEADINYLMTLSKTEEKKKGTRLIDDDYVKLIKGYAKKEITDLNRKVVAPKPAKTTPKSKKKAVTVTRESQLWD
jgi:hypothetical protein